jgi:hypothetical protein
MPAENAAGIASAASYYARHGWPVFPVGRDKAPLTPRGFHDATTDETVVASWWREHPDAGIAVPTGNGTVVLDVDPREGGDDTLHQLEQRHGELPPTVEALTGGGGRHLYFRTDEPIRNSASRVGPGLDVRAAGGYVVVPPSPHPSGRWYEWSVDGHPAEVEKAQLPGWLADRMRDQNGRAAVPPIGETIPAGRRNHVLTSLAGSMRRRGAEAPEILAALVEMNRRRCKPQLDERELEKIANSVGRYPPAPSGHDPVDVPARQEPRQDADDVADGVEEQRLSEPLRTNGAVVDGQALLDELGGFMRRFLVVSDDQLCVLALWVLHTHAFAAFEMTPYLLVRSPEKRCGKSRLLDVLKLLAKTPIATANITEAALFRAVELYKPTLLVDEVDIIFAGKDDRARALAGLLNAGYEQGGSALRVGGPSRDRLEEFSAFCPKALAGIGSKLPDTTVDRCIPIEMKRRTPGERVERFKRRRARGEADGLRKRCADWAEQRLEELEAARPELPDQLDDRAQEIAEPLFAVANIAGGDWPERVRSAIVALRGGESADDDSAGVRLLSDIRAVFDGRDRVPSSEPLAGLNALEESPWGEWYGKPLTSRGLAKLLDRYAIKPRNVRLADGTTPKGYRRDQFDDAWDRYLPQTPPEGGSIRHSATNRLWSGIEPNPYPPQDPLVADSKSGANPHGKRDVADVADRTATQDEEAEIERVLHKFAEGE